MTTKTITARARVERRSRSAGLSIAQLNGEHLPAHLDPFLAFDHFAMAQPFFPPHPHAGFSAVTYMFPQSAGGFINRDSAGSKINIHPGDLHWTAAGSGIIHEEVPSERGVTCSGLQIFVNLPAGKKWMAPQALHLDAAAVPRAQSAAADVRIVLGRHGDLSSPLVPPTAVTLLDVVIPPGGHFEHIVPEGESRFLYVIDGAVAVGAGAEHTVLEQGEAAGFSTSGDRLVVSAPHGTTHVVVAGGVPLKEATVFYGPFCMSSRADVLRAVQAYESGRMGQLEASF